MRKELFETGKSVDLAIDSACKKLECLREDCEWEIIDLPRRSFLGLKNTPAKVRVSIEVPNIIPEVKAVVPEQPVKQAARQNLPERHVSEKPVKEKKAFDSPRSGHPRKEIKQEGISPEDYSEKEKQAISYLTEILEAAGLKAGYTITREYGGSCVKITGESLGMIIGRRGETLDAIQYLTGLAVNRGEGDYLRLTVDCGDYRLKRKDTLEALAKRLADQVIKLNVSKVLEPMNPFERRVIHATVSQIEGVSSSSIGDEPNRRVVITSPTARPAPRGGFRNDRRDDSRDGYNRDRGPRRQTADEGERPARPARNYPERGGRDRDDRRRGGGGGRRPPQQAVQAPQGPPKKTPESEVTSGISFGKIELE